MKVTFLIASLVVLPVLYVICFHFGWGNPIISAPWIFWCYVAGLIYAIGHAIATVVLPSDNRWVLLGLTGFYYVSIFALSCLAIIHGWGMYPKNWIVIVVSYAAAALLPPFSQVTQYLNPWMESDTKKSLANAETEIFDLESDLQTYGTVVRRMLALLPPNHPELQSIYQLLNSMKQRTTI